MGVGEGVLTGGVGEKDEKGVKVEDRDGVVEGVVERVPMADRVEVEVSEGVGVSFPEKDGVGVMVDPSSREGEAVKL